MFLLPEFARGTVSGTIEEVSVSPVAEISNEFTATGLINRSSPASPGGEVDGTYYQVRARLDQPAVIDSHEVAIPVRTTGHARIQVRPASTLERLLRFIGQTFQSPN